MRAAIAVLPEHGIAVRQVSSIYETEPVDYLDQPWFLNCVVKAETQLAPAALLRALRSIEAHMGSQKEFAKGPRLLDIDILLYGNETIQSPELQIPHPRMSQRRFVLVPLAEIAPTLRHPSWDGDVEAMLARTADPSAVQLLS